MGVMTWWPQSKTDNWTK